MEYTASSMNSPLLNPSSSAQPHADQSATPHTPAVHLRVTTAPFPHTCVATPPCGVISNGPSAGQLRSRHEPVAASHSPVMPHTRLITLPDSHVCVYSPGADAGHSPSSGHWQGDSASSHTP